MIREDFCLALGCGDDGLAPEYGDFAEAVAMFLFSTGNLEKAATTGALVFTAARLP